MPRKISADRIVFAAALAALIALALLRSAQQGSQVSVPSTYDTGAAGYAAVYELLAREGIARERFEFPLAHLARTHGTLVLAGDGALAKAAPSKSALSVLDRWVSAGGHLVVLDAALPWDARTLLALPPLHAVARSEDARTACAFTSALRGLQVAAEIDAAYSSTCTAARASVLRSGGWAPAILLARGRGTIALLTTPAFFDNFHLAQRENARVAYALLSAPPVLFDERVHGHAAGRTFWEVLPGQMHAAIVLAIFAVVLAVIGANIPFAPAYAAAPPEERDSGAYIASLAQMLQRAGAGSEAIARIARRCEQVLGLRAFGDERARMLLRELRTLESTPHPGPNDVLQAGRIFARVRKDYGC